MATGIFHGQQDGERVLYTVTPHHLSKKIAVASVVLLALFFFLMVMIIGIAVPPAAPSVYLIGSILCVTLLVVGLWFTVRSYDRDRTYITDRRIIRFETVPPNFLTKRALFWNEALKAKAYAPNMIFRMMNIGMIEVEPVMGEGENVRVPSVGYYEDLCNYIDKILYTVKNTPDALAGIKPFVPKPRGQRG